MQGQAVHAGEVRSADAVPNRVPVRLLRRGIVGAAVAAATTTSLSLQDASATVGQVLRTNPSEETIRLGPLAVRFLVTADDSSGSVAAFEVSVPARQRLAAPAHSHDHYEETIYGLSGVLTWTVNGQQVEVGPGQALCIPRGAVHRFDNHGDVDVRALCVLTPGAIGPLFFRESAEVLNASAGGPPDVARMIAVMRRHGLTPARP
jgi:quercetin dioxygenase-like cupin family protein